MVDQVQDTFRSSLGGWFWGTAAGLGTLVLGLLGIALTIAAAGNWHAWPLVLTGIALVDLAVQMARRDEFACTKSRPSG